MITFKELECSNWIMAGGYNYNVEDQLERYVEKRSEEKFNMGDAQKDVITDIESFEKYRSLMREKFIGSMGGLPKTNTPLNAECRGVFKGNGFVIEKIIYESNPGIYVTSNLYIPDDIISPCAAIIFVCGHANLAKSCPEYQAVCQYLAHSGMVVFSLDPMGQGERYSYYEKSIGRDIVRPGTMDHTYGGLMCLPLGQSVARYFVYDIIRAVDYLYTRPEVDRERIGITGNSGGGVQSSLAMICDQRIAAAAPANYITNRRAYLYAGQGQDIEQIWPGMTDLGFDHEDVIMMMAPKPVLILGCTYDFFPIEGTRSTYNRVKRFWKLYGQLENIEMFESLAPHEYNMEMAKKAVSFFSFHFMGRKATVDDGITIYSSAMRQMRSGIPRDERKVRAMDWLRKKVVGGRIRCELNPRHLLETWIDELLCTGSYWWTQEGIFNHWFIFRHYKYKEEHLPVIVAIWENGTANLHMHSAWIREMCNAGKAVVVLDVTGIGMVHSNIKCTNINDKEFGDFYKPACDLFFLNDSLAAVRVYDVIRAVDLLYETKCIKNEDIKIFSDDRYGIYGQLAYLLDRRIKKLEISGGIGSFEKLVSTRFYDLYDVISIIIPGILGYLDLTDIPCWRQCEDSTILQNIIL